ncbi:CdaR family protein [Alkalihalobacillus sp. MEB130]|uniref:CdaR family protein n=1 Tax=Alkalihalobacillus sp. MEB130 TaxID=2976704 RepID=UPI0028DF9FF2|nr:CdaR family protein [Alkalihalobacillus sp. MEB130]MDT8862774.1 CdaR family protein [Alkalihalobacillus sp. MEB130]
MDKLFNSHWFVKIISFFIALMLFTMVNIDNMASQPGVLPTISPASYTLEDVELVVHYDEENYAITDKTEHVQVNLKGPQGSLTLFQLTRPSYEVFVDVRERGEGVHTLSVQHRNFPSDLSVSIVPQYVRVELQEKQTVSFPVQVDIINSNEVEEGYTVGTPIVSPLNVDVTAARSLVAEVHEVKAYVDVAGADRALEETTPVRLYDEDGNELTLSVDPQVVDVRVPITSPNRTVPARVTRVGELPDGVSINELKVEPEELTVYGPRDVIDRMNVIEVGELDLTELTESQTIEMDVPIPPGVERVSPETVTVTVSISAEETEEFTDVPIEVIGGREGEEISFDGNTTREVTIAARGSEESLAKLQLTDIQAFIDVSDLSTGVHEVGVQINGPPNIRFSTMEETIPIEIISQ